MLLFRSEPKKPYVEIIHGSISLLRPCTSQKEILNISQLSCHIDASPFQNVAIGTVTTAINDSLIRIGTTFSERLLSVAPPWWHRFLILCHFVIADALATIHRDHKISRIRREKQLSFLFIRVPAVLLFRFRIV